MREVGCGEGENAGGELDRGVRGASRGKTRGRRRGGKDGVGVGRVYSMGAVLVAQSVCHYTAAVLWCYFETCSKDLNFTTHPRKLECERMCSVCEGAVQARPQSKRT